MKIVAFASRRVRAEYHAMDRVVLVCWSVGGQAAESSMLLKEISCETDSRLLVR